MKALLVVDVQNDFLPGGALAVPEGDAVVGVINGLRGGYGLIVASQDWHPVGHGSFASQHGRDPFTSIDLHGLDQVLWPDHCVQGSPGADFAPGLEQDFAYVVRKGMDPTVDSYSAFFDNGRRNDTGLADWLRSAGVTALDVVGLATDYCVKWTALDAASCGFETRVLLAGCRGLGEVDAAVAELRAAGVDVV